MMRLVPWLALSAMLLPAQPLVWFSPLDPLLRPEVGYGGSPQYLQLFVPDAPWMTAASRVQVFKIYTQWALGASDSDLRQQFADLQRRGIALALEFPALSPTPSCGRGVEGFGGDPFMSVIQRIKDLGGDLAYLAMDEPIYFATLYTGTNACRWTVQQTVDNAAVNLRAILKIFPNVQIGDIEPFSSSNAGASAQYAQGLDAFQSALGFPLAFFHADLEWSSTGWRANVDAMREQVQSRAIPFGVIYNGGATDGSDGEWLASAEAHMVAYETGAGAPDQVIFQSWNGWPQKLLPESDHDSFTALINRYFRARTTLTLSVDQGVASGSLSIGPGGTIQLTATPLSGDGQELDYVVTGATPPGVKQLVFGVRVNEECGCSGPSAFTLRSFQLDVTDSSTVARDFGKGLVGWSVSDASLAAVNGDVLQVTAAAGQPLLVNSAPIAFAVENGAFRLTVRAKVKPLSNGSGYFIVAFLGANREIGRFHIPIAAPAVALGAATTLDDGTYQFALPPLDTGSWLVRGTYAGSDDWWPAVAEANVSVDAGQRAVPRYDKRR